MTSKKLRFALAGAGICTFAMWPGAPGAGNDAFDPLLDGGPLCGPQSGGPAPILRALILAKAETAPFQPVPAQPAMGEAPVLYENLGTLTFKAGTSNRRAQAWFDQGVRLSFAFNHAEAQRAFREAQKLDPKCALCFWGEALILGPNINVPMMPEANPPALAALAKAVELEKAAPPRDRALIAALAQRYSSDPKAVRADLDAAYAKAMGDVAQRFPRDDTVQVLYAEALMDTQPWDYWEAGGAKPKGNGAAIVGTLEKVLKRNPRHPGAIHLYIHAVEASTHPERALPYARELGQLMPGAGHVVHMPAHIYYRVGLYRDSLATNQRAMAVDERYFKTSPSDPLYKSAYYPHNIHFLMVSAQMGGDGKTAIDAAAKLDAALPVEVGPTVRDPAAHQGGAVHDARAVLRRRNDPEAPGPARGARSRRDDVSLRARARLRREKGRAVRAEGNRHLAGMERDADFKPFAEWGMPAKEIVGTARLVAMGRLADANGDLEGAAKAYDDAVFIEDSLAYMEPPYWYYPVRQSLAAVRLRQGKLDEAEKIFRESLSRVRNNAWALAGLDETYRRKGDAAAEKATRQAFAKAWLGNPAGPAIERL